MKSGLDNLPSTSFVYWAPNTYQASRLSQKSTNFWHRRAETAGRHIYLDSHFSSSSKPDKICPIPLSGFGSNFIFDLKANYPFGR